MEQKRTRKNYPQEFKFEVLSYYYSHGERRRQTYEKYGINECLLRQWIKAFPIEKKGVSLQSELKTVMHMEQLQKEDTQENMLQKIAQLEKALEYEKMRCRGYEKLIEIAEREEGISILKKDGAKQ